MTTRKKVEAINTFHNSHATAWAGADGYLNRRQANRMWTILCGSEGCVCCGYLGDRGPVTLDGQPASYKTDWDGGATVFAV